LTRRNKEEEEEEPPNIADNSEYIKYVIIDIRQM
jgi:hypothetical protein